MKSIDLYSKTKTLNALRDAIGIIQSIPVTRSCHSCAHYRGGCGLADYKMPPQNILKDGCEAWEENDTDFIPY